MITGTTGWLGKELATQLAQANKNKGQYEIFGLARRPTNIPGVTSIQADITSDLSGILSESYDFDVIVHLAGAAGWCSLEQGLDINVNGTKNVIRATRKQSQKQKYIIASSVAVTGTCSPNFPPKKLPIGNDDGFVGSDFAYGLSKHMVEEVVKFIGATDEEPKNVDILLIRIGGVVTDPPGPLRHLETAIDEEVIIEPAVSSDGPKESILPEFPLLAIALSDMLDCLSLAIHEKHKPGVRTITAVGPSAFSKEPVADVMESWYGENSRKIDLTHHRIPGNEFSPIYDTEAAERELGFVAKVDLRQECL